MILSSFVLTLLSVMPNLAFAQQTQLSLFVDPPGEASQPRSSTPQEPYVVRARQVGVNFAALAGPARGGTARRDPSAGETITLNLFPDTSVSAILLRFERHTDGRYIWAGHVAGQPDNEAIFVVHRGVLTAEITDGSRAFSVRPGRSGAHQILEIDRRLLPPEHMPVDPGEATLPDRKDTPNSTKDSASSIRILVLYTPSARQSAGGTTAIQNLAALGVAQTNNAFANSGLGTRLSLAHTQEVVYSESSSMETDLNWLSSSVGTLRDQFAADLVAMLTHGVRDSCGIAWLFGPGSSSAFSVTDHRCMSNLTFPHEIGHNFGAGHDPFVGDGGYYYDSQGYVRIGGSLGTSWRTVMSYDWLCFVWWFGNDCPILNVFSNPDVYYSGAGAGPTGVAGISNNARVIGNTGGTIANYRSGGGGTTTPGAPSNLTASASGSTATISWSAPSSGGAPTAYILEAGSSSGATNIVVSNVGNVTSLMPTGVPNNTFFIRVRATNPAGTSGPSNEVVLVVGGGPGPCTGAPGAPTNLTFSVSGSTVTLRWTAPGGGNAPTTYIVQAGSGSGLSNLVEGSDLGGPNTTLVANDVGTGTYYVRILGRNSCGTGIASNEVIVIVQ